MSKFCSTAPTIQTVEYGLLKAIYQHRAEWNAYLAASLDDDDAPRSYKRSLTALEEWTAPATDRMEAAEAMRVALHFYEIGDSAVIPAMMKAALGFLERAEA